MTILLCYLRNCDTDATAKPDATAKTYQNSTQPGDKYCFYISETATLMQLPNLMQRQKPTKTAFYCCDISYFATLLEPHHSHSTPAALGCTSKQH